MEGRSMIIDDQLLNEISSEAKESPRLRKNYNFHHSAEDGCQRFLNALQPGTEVPIHRHDNDETFIILRGKIVMLYYNDKGEEITKETIYPKEGQYGVFIPSRTWHSLTVLDEDTVIFETVPGPYRPRRKDQIMNIEK